MGASIGGGASVGSVGIRFAAVVSGCSWADINWTLAGVMDSSRAVGTVASASTSSVASSSSRGTCLIAGARI